MLSRDEVEARVSELMSKVLKLPNSDLSLVTRTNTPNWTSLVHVELFFALEEEFGIEMTNDDVAFSESRDEIVEAVLQNQPKE